MNNIILKYFFNFYKGYTEKSTEKYEFIVYYIASISVLAITLFFTIIGFITVLNYNIENQISISKKLMYLYMLVSFIIAYIYIYYVKKISFYVCEPENYNIEITKKSKYISYISFVLCLIISVIIISNY